MFVSKLEFAQHKRQVNRIIEMQKRDVLPPLSLSLRSGGSTSPSAFCM